MNRLCLITPEPASLFIVCLPLKTALHPFQKSCNPGCGPTLAELPGPIKLKTLAAGGVADHCHVLISLPPTIAVAKAVQLIKSGSSKWMHDNGQRKFDWQEGYGGFTIGMSQVSATVRYISNQPRHHSKTSFADEWKMILKKHGLDEEAWSDED